VLLFLSVSPVFAFQPHSASRRGVVQTRAALDPNDILSTVAYASHPDLPVLLSTMITSSIAHGHSNPIFGRPDQYLNAGHSIAPTAKALMDMGVPISKSVQDMIPDAAPVLQQKVETAMKHGWPVLNRATMMNGGATHLPGFTETRGILPQAGNPNVPPPGTPGMMGTWLRNVEFAATYSRVLDKLPTAAFMYVLLEFFILRPGVDVYKEDIEDDPSGVLAETVAATGVRFAALGIIGVFTNIIFG
jgi:hypothetical protein